MAASHSGEQGHVETLQRLQERYGLAEELLLCGSHEPYYLPAIWKYGRDDRPITYIHCNCSGKHTAMLLASQAQGWPLENYTDPNHPVQLANTSRIASYLGKPPDAVEYGVDGCQVPTWWISIREAALAFARFCSPRWHHSDLEKRAIERIFDAFHNAPWHMAGTNRFDTPFNRESDGKWIGKIGGEGIFSVAFRHRGLAVVVKVIDGNTRAISPALLHAMKIWHLIDDDQLTRLKDWAEVVRLNTPGNPIGFIRIAQR